MVRSRGLQRGKEDDPSPTLPFFRNGDRLLKNKEWKPSRSSRKCFRMRRRGLSSLALIIMTILFFADSYRIHRQGWRRRHALASQPVPTIFDPAERIFISSIFWNSETILRASWSAALVNLTLTLGRENVYVSIYESGSWDNTKSALRDLEAELGALKIPHTIILNETTHSDELGAAHAPSTPGWITLPAGTRPQARYPDLIPGTTATLRRIPFLADQRNRALAPFYTSSQPDFRPFTKLLFLNDVTFTTTSILTLLQTNKGDYAAACALDYAHPPSFYDTFALRDSASDSAITSTWPFFRPGSDSYHDITSGQEAVRVSSCWNGAVVMPALSFLQPLSAPLDRGSQTSSSTSARLRFRAIPDSLALQHLEASECCLVHADNPLRHKGVYVNQRVRVAYSADARDRTPTSAQDGGWKEIWLNRIGALIGKDASGGQRMNARVRRRRLDQWQTAQAGSEIQTESGELCLIDEMQVLRNNGWAHV